MSGEGLKREEYVRDEWDYFRARKGKDLMIVGVS